MPNTNLQNLYAAWSSDRRRYERVASVEDFRRLAKRRLPRAVFDFVDGGAGDEHTVRWNEDAYRQYVFRPRVLTDTSGLDVSTTVLGRRIELPVILGPAGSQGLVSRHGELDAARAAAASGTVYVLGVSASHTIEQVRDAAPDGRLWFQLYLDHGRRWAEDLLARAHAANYEALVMTVDFKKPGARKYRDIRNGIVKGMPGSLGPRTIADAARRPRWVANYLRAAPIEMVHMVENGRAASLFQATETMYRNINADATWEAVQWVRSIWEGPLVIKGIMHEQDAAQAFNCGADAIICSNHGGRGLDDAPATLDVLPRIVEAAGDHDVFIDGGIRTGGDVVKALALGASVCAIARPFFWGLAAGGQSGVEAVLEIFKREIEATISALGASAVAELDGAVIERRASALSSARASADGPHSRGQSFPAVPR